MRLFIDLDGTLAEWRENACTEDTYKQNYYASLKCHYNLIQAVHLLKSLYPEIEVFSLSVFWEDSEFAKKEKDFWLDEHVSFIDKEHRIFVPYGNKKTDYVPNGLSSSDVLIDDYNVNLIDWQSKGGSCIKFVNYTNSVKNWNDSFITKEYLPEGILVEILSAFNYSENAA